MFQPSRNDVRLFLCGTYQKPTAELTPIELIARHWINQHPEYHALLADTQSALTQEFTPQQGQMNPFLHLSLHLSLSEQISIDQPQGVREVAQRLYTQHDEHSAQHLMLDVLAAAVWQAQQPAQRFNVQHYLEQLQRLT